MEKSYDVVVLGSGIAGSILGLCLARIGARTLVLERRSHPRFAIGESGIPATTMMFRQLGRTYGIPELCQVSHYVGARELGIAAWPKQLFWAGQHEDGVSITPNRELIIETLLPPYGPDCHWLRADLDGYLSSRLEHYGAHHREESEVVALESVTGGARLTVRRAEGTREVHARLVVDASGHASALARSRGLRDASPRLSTNTRTVFGHFTAVRDLEELLGPNDAFRFKRSAGTQHHCFRGGWIWVIPFDNGLTSVGVVLDRDTYPLDESVSPERELAAFIRRFPTVAQHLGDMVPARPVVRTDRVQFTSSRIVGPGYILAPHAAGFVDALWSTGMALTGAFVVRLVPLVRAALADGDFSEKRFFPLDATFQAELSHIDRFVAASILSFRHPELMKQVVSAALLCAAVDYGARMFYPEHIDLQLFGGSLPDFRQTWVSAHEQLRADDGDPIGAAHRIRDLFAVWSERLTQWQPHGDPGVLSSGSVSYGMAASGGRTALSDTFAAALWEKRMRDLHAGVLDASTVDQYDGWRAEASGLMDDWITRYDASRREGTSFQKIFDTLANTATTFDYVAHARAFHEASKAPSLI